MVDDIKAALESQKIRKAAIVDDLFDPEPTYDQIDEGDWNNFYDDLYGATAELDLISKEFEESDIHAARPDMASERRRQFVSFIWKHRSGSAIFDNLFKAYLQRAAGGRSVLETLKSLLETDLGLSVDLLGSTEGGADADIIFLDLFLGVTDQPPARANAIARILGIVRERFEKPPLVILMSSSPQLEDMRDAFRDEAGLLGCQFRMLQKVEIESKERICEILYRLVVRYQDTLRLAKFVSAWNQALQTTGEQFLRKIRRLDLRDYANIQRLVLDAEKDQVGRYLLEVYDLFFHSLLEGDEHLAEASKDIDHVSWSEYPPPHFLPASEPAEILDGLLFHHPRIVSDDAPTDLGDILLVHLDAASAAAEVPPLDIASGQVRLFVVLTQACDLRHDRASRVLFLTGTGRPSQLVHHLRPDPEITPALVIGGNHYIVEWNVTDPVSCTPGELKQRLISGQYRRVRRFRLSNALQLQQKFAANLTRVGTMVLPPLQHVAGLSVLFRAKGGDLRLIESVDPSQQQAVIMVGRDSKNLVDYFTMSYDLVDKVRTALRKVSMSDVHAPEKWEAMLSNRAPFAALEVGISFNRNGRKRPWIDQAAGCPDILEVVGPYAKDQPEPGAQAGSKFAGPLVFQIWLGPTAESVIPKPDGEVD